jgi:hypothetical protein
VNWRVVLPLGILTAVVLGAVGVWENQRVEPVRSCVHVGALPAVPSVVLTDPVSGQPETIPGKAAQKATSECGRTGSRTFHHDATLAWYAAGSVALLTFASLPLLMQWERRR